MWETSVFHRLGGGGKVCAVRAKLLPPGSQEAFSNTRRGLNTQLTQLFVPCEDAASRYPHGRAAGKARRGKKIMACFVRWRKKPGLSRTQQVFFSWDSGIHITAVMNRFDSLNRNVCKPRSICSVFNFSVAENPLRICPSGVGVLWGETLKWGILSVPFKSWWQFGYELELITTFLDSPRDKL